MSDTPSGERAMSQLLAELRKRDTDIASLTTTNKKLRDAALRLAVHATGLHVTPVDTDALGDLLKLALKEEE